PVSAVQIFSVLSGPALTMCLPSGLKAAACPAREKIPAPVATSHTSAAPLSLEPMMRLLSGLNDRPLTEPLCGMMGLLSGLYAGPLTARLCRQRMVRTSVPLAASHTLISPTELLLTMRLPSGLYATQVIGDTLWPSRVRTSAPVSASHIFSFV